MVIAVQNTKSKTFERKRLDISNRRITSIFLFLGGSIKAPLSWKLERPYLNLKVTLLSRSADDGNVDFQINSSAIPTTETKHDKD